MDVSAADVFSMMAEDCKGSEDETGASRRKILDFLQASSAKRAEVLESGKDVEAEKAFAEGFYEVIQTTAFAEKRQILTLLLSLSTISGRNATPATTGRYAKAVTRCLKPNSPVALTTPIIRLWAELLKRKPELDPRWTIYFLADHGAAVVSLLTDKQDKQAQEILLAHTLDPRRLIRSVEDRTDRDLGAKDLVPDFAETMLKAAQVRRLPRKEGFHGVRVELISPAAYIEQPRKGRCARDGTLLALYRHHHQPLDPRFHPWLARTISQRRVGLRRQAKTGFATRRAD